MRGSRHLLYGRVELGNVTESGKGEWGTGRNGRTNSIYGRKWRRVWRGGIDKSTGVWQGRSYDRTEAR